MSIRSPKSLGHAGRLLVMLLFGGSAILVTFLSKDWIYEAAGSYRPYDAAPLQRVPQNAPFITSPEPVIAKMLELAKVSDRDLVYDLGCGDGRIVIAAAGQRGCHGVGFELDPKLVKEAQKNALASGVDGLVTIEQRDIFTVDMSKADVILMYLLPWMVEKLAPQFEPCRPGTRIVSHAFEIAGIQEDETVTMTVGDREYFLYVYTTPLRKDPNGPKWRNWK